MIYTGNMCHTLHHLEPNAVTVVTFLSRALMVHVLTCTIYLELIDVHTLKEKRRIVRSITSRLAREFNVAIAEIDHLDVSQSAVLALATVGNDAAYLHGRLERAVAWIEQQRPDVPIGLYTIEQR